MHRFLPECVDSWAAEFCPSASPCDDDIRADWVIWSILPSKQLYKMAKNSYCLDQFNLNCPLKTCAFSQFLLTATLRSARQNDARVLKERQIWRKTRRRMKKNVGVWYVHGNGWDAWRNSARKRWPGLWLQLLRPTTYCKCLLYKISHSDQITQQ